MLKRFRGAAVAAVVALVASVGISYAAGLWSTLPIIGGSSYCASYVTGTGNLSGATGQGQGTIGQICGQTVPAGPATFAGTEMLPMDLLTPGTQSQGPTTTALATIGQLGQGPLLDVTTVASATIPNGDTFYAVDQATASAFTLTMPANAIDGTIQRVLCTATTTGNMTIQGNTTAGQTAALKPAWTAGVCTAGTSYAFRYNAANTSWYRFQ